MITKIGALWIFMMTLLATQMMFYAFQHIINYWFWFLIYLASVVILGWNPNNIFYDL